MLLISISVRAQKKVDIYLNFKMYKSIGRNNLKNYKSKDSILSYDYYSKKKFDHPYISISSALSYPIFKKLKVSMETGIYIHFSELYVSFPPKSRILIPLQASVSYQLLELKKKSFGLSSSIGFVFFDINELIERYKNGSLYSFSLFYSIRKKVNLSVGIEKQIDNVSLYVDRINPYSKNEIYNYSINRLSCFISYGVCIN
jgi:hypothetical protein